MLFVGFAIGKELVLDFFAEILDPVSLQAVSSKLIPARVPLDDRVRDWVVPPSAVSVLVVVVDLDEFVSTISASEAAAAVVLYGIAVLTGSEDSIAAASYQIQGYKSSRKQLNP